MSSVLCVLQSWGLRIAHGPRGARLISNQCAGLEPQFQSAPAEGCGGRFACGPLPSLTHAQGRSSFLSQVWSAWVWSGLQTLEVERRKGGTVRGLGQGVGRASVVPS